ncbi:hypothetical protein FZ934_02285 [Rhizobium grahamii]|uniref:Adenylate cyclase n=1 Tax=Rhizobium grahamii TaxID=1120045 RepID=A0A5Q0C5P2_9HYPH|nr:MULTISPECIES: hypothetical protein [Rhizobium]QFY59367.1 hypothetical protein FZ934_02285 [Rhizobium grahamii]QRM48105.1 hypothetical protein F3Y33_01590 [Rhizobium sp. BG6]
MISAGVEGANRGIPSSEEVRQQLDRILSSSEFRLPERARRFLEFVIDETLGGRREYLKAFTIAQAVFGRDANFDAQQDPCVRIEAGRLRRELEHYYLTAGAADEIIITIPKGGYAPAFEVRRTAEALDDALQPSREQVEDRPIAARGRPGYRYWAIAGSAAIVLVSATAVLQYMRTPDAANAPAAGAGDRPTILVERFESVTDGRLASDISRGITDDIIEKLVPFNEIGVVTAVPPNKDQAAAAQPSYALQGSVRLEGNTLRSTARLVRRADGAVIWANNYDADMQVQGVLKTQTSVAEDIATAVARPFGVMFRTDTETIAGSDDTYACVLSYYSYRNEMTSAAHDAAQSCLQRAVEKMPGDSNVAALLSLTHLDEFRFAFQLNTKPTAATLKTAKGLAEHAVQLDPNNARALQALMLASFFGNDMPEALRAGAAAYASNPNDTEVAGEYGLRLSMSGEWGKGCELVSTAVSRNAGPRGYYEVGMALCAFMRGDTQAAELWSRMSDLDYNPMHRLVLLSILGALGKGDEAREQIDWLKSKAPAVIPNIGPEVEKRLARKQDQARFFAGLRAAGLPVQTDAPLQN